MGVYYYKSEERLKMISKILEESKEPVKSKIMAEELGVSSKTIQRDIKKLRGTNQIIIGKLSKSGGYFKK